MDALIDNLPKLLDRLRSWRGVRSGIDSLAVFSGLLYAALPQQSGRTADFLNFLRGVDVSESSPEWVAEAVEHALQDDSLMRPVLGTLVAQIRATPPVLLRELSSWVGIFDCWTPRGRQVARAALDYLTGYFTSQRELGQFSTPARIADLMVALADLRPDERVYDPCFGLGGLLAAAGVEQQHSLGSLALDMDRPSELATTAESEPRLFGTEINPYAYLVGAARIALSGAPVALRLGDALVGSELALQQRFDCVLMAPPWGVRANQPEYLWQTSNIPVRTSDIEAQFIQHALLALAAGGRAIVAASKGFLFKSGSQQHVREWILNHFQLEGVLTLPSGAFAPFTNVQGAILVIRNSPPAPSTRFAELSSLRQRKSGQEVIDSARMRAETLEALVAYRSGQGGGVVNAPRHSLESNWLPAPAQSRQLDEFLAELRREHGIPSRTLGSVAAVERGIAYRSAQTVAGSLSTGPGLIRVSDLSQGGEIRTPRLSLLPDARLPEAVRLRAGDVLVATTGSIGKVALAGPELAGAVASSGLTVIRARSISPEYLAAILSSRLYNQWMVERARGATIQHLSSRLLRDLRVPVPDTAQQHYLAGASRELLRSTDPHVLALQFVGSPSASVVTELVDTPPITALLKDMDRDDLGEKLPDLGAAARTILAYRNRVAHDTVGQPNSPILVRWLLEIGDVARQVRSLGDIPAGPARYAVVENARLALQLAFRTLDGAPEVGPEVEQARQVTRALAVRLGREQELLLSDVSLVGSITPQSVVMSVAHEVQLRLRNESLLPVRDLTITTQPDLGSSRLAFVAEGQTVSIPLTIPAATDSDLQFLVAWRATQVDGRQRTGEIALAVEIRPTPGSDDVHADLGASPYVVGRPVPRDDMLFGRSEQIARIKRLLARRETTNVVLLEGNRRAGKTSILLALGRDEDIVRDWVPVYISLQGGEGSEDGPGLETREIFRLLARNIGLALMNPPLNLWPLDTPPQPHVPLKRQFTHLLDGLIPQERPFEHFEYFLESALSLVRPHGILLMLDEFDKLQEGIDSHITSPQVPENIRYLLHTHEDLSAILTGSRRLKRLREEYWSALFGIGSRVPVGPLDFDDARRLVIEPVKGRLVFVAEAADRLVKLCACQPYLIQSLCNRVFDRAAERGERTITLSAVEAAAAETVRDNEHFATLWQYAGSDVRRLILQLCVELEEGPDRITSELLRDRLRELRISRSAAGFTEDLMALRELELLQEQNDGHGLTYRAAIPLMATWIREHQDFLLQVEAARREAEESL